MKEIMSVVTRKGQITLPAELRKFLGIEEGDKVALSLLGPDKRQIRLRPVRSVAELTFGVVTPRKQPEDFDELRQRFEDGIVEEVMTETSPAEDE